MSLLVKAEFVIRPARLADVDELTQLEQRNFQYDVLSRRSFSRFLKGNTARIFVADIQSHLAGYIILLMRKHSQRARIYSLAVSEQCRGHQLGRLLVEEAIKYSQHIGKKAVYLEVQVNNNAAIHLYEKLGFERKSIKREYYDDRQDAFSYELVIGSA